MALPRNIHSFGIGGLGALGTKPMPPKPDASGNCPPGYERRTSGMGGKGQPVPTYCAYVGTTAAAAASAPTSPTASIMALFAPQVKPAAASPGARADAPSVAATAAWLTPLALAGVAGIALLFVLRRR